MSEKQLSLAEIEKQLSLVEVAHPAVKKEPYEAPTVRTLTIAEAREELKAHLDEGVECPVCGQFAKVYKRALRAALVVSLIHIYKFFRTNPATEWLDDTPAYLRTVGTYTTNDVALLRHWRLLEPRPGVRGDGSWRTGSFRITHEGRAFVRGVLKVPRFAVLYNQELLQLEGDLISVKDALGDDFDYSELMEAR